MTGYELLSRLKKARRQHVLTATEQALYHELGSICNEGDWCQVFACSNEELCRALNISENTLINSRNSLLKSGLVYYRSGKSRRSFGEYSFEVILTTSKSEVVPVVDESATTSKSEVEKPVLAAVTTSKFEDYTKPNKQTSVSKETVPKKTTSKSEVVKKSKAEDRVEYWQVMVDLWFEFYKKEFGTSPTFKGAAPKALKTILEQLKRVSVEANKEWTEVYAKKVFTHFLTRAIADSWRKENFMLHILSSHFDAIVQKKEPKQTKQAEETDQYLEQRKINEERTKKLLQR